MQICEKTEKGKKKEGEKMVALLITISMVLAVMFTYSLVVLRSLREELKAKNNLLRLYKTYNGEVKLP